MDGHEIYRRWMVAQAEQLNPEVVLESARRDRADAERSLMCINETLESFDREAIYKTGWYESGDEYWNRCDTRQTSKCYLIKDRSRNRRFRRNDVECDQIPSGYHGYHLGRFIYADIVEEQRVCAEKLNRCSQELRVIESQIAEGRPVIGSLETTIHREVDRVPSKINWKKEGF